METTNPTGPLFSVIIPAFNAKATLPLTIESVLAQTCTDYEVIVVDDGSTEDGSQVGSTNDGRVALIHQPNQGPAAARNTGVRAAKGRWMALLDSDDTWTPIKLATIERAAHDNPSAVMVYSDANCLDETRTIIRGPFTPPELNYAPSMADMLAGRCQILPSTVVIKAEAYRTSGGFSEQFRSPGVEDVEFWVRLRELGPFVYLQERIVNYRVTPLEQRLQRYGKNLDIFCRVIRERYGADGEALIAVRRKARVTSWAHIGLLAMRDGDSAKARWALGNALRENPLRLKNRLRYLRTYLPLRMARALAERSDKS